MSETMSCLDAVAVQGFVEGTLGATERTAVEAHVDGCPSCRRLIAALAMTTPPTLGTGMTAMTTSPSPTRTDHSQLLAIGTEVGRYRVVGYLGRGGMGIVYHAHDPELRRDVALKLLRSDRVSDSEESSARLLREAQSMAQIAHPNVIAVFDVGEWNDEVFVAMELVGGGTLRAWCERPHEPPEILAAFVSAGRGLAAAHAAGLVHRDFKPDNVLVGTDGRMRVTDFGLARTHDVIERRLHVSVDSTPLVDLTATGAVMGTPGYMAPELYVGEASDARTDQFAFCVALWEALHGTKPFVAKTEAELVDAIETGEIAPVPKRIAAPINRALRRGLSARPGDRWPTMEALLGHLVRRRKRWPIVAASVGMLAIAGVVAYQLWPASAPGVVVGLRDAGVDPNVAIGKEAAAATPMLRSAMNHWTRGERKLAREELEEAIARARAAKVTPILITELITQGNMLGSDGDYSGAESSFNEALELAEKTGDDRQRVQAITQLVSLLDRAGRPDERLRKLAAATATRLSTDDDTRATMLEAEGDHTDDIEVAKAKLAEALVIRDKLGIQTKRASNRTTLASRFTRTEDYDSARTVMRDALTYLDDHGQDPEDIALARVSLLSILASVEMVRADWTAAAKAANEVIEISRAHHGFESVFTGPALVELGAALAHQGKRAEGDAAFAQALELSHGSPIMETQLHQTMALTYHDDPTRSHDAAVEVDKAVEVLTQSVGTDSPNAVLLRVLQLKLLVADHQLDRVRQLAEVLLPKVEKDPLEQADVRFALARALPAGDHPRAEQLARQALAVYVNRGKPSAAARAKVEAWLAHPP